MAACLFSQLRECLRAIGGNLVSSYDADGSGVGAAVPFALLGTGLVMTNVEFVVT